MKSFGVHIVEGLGYVLVKLGRLNGKSAGPSKVGGRRRFVAASSQSHRRLLFAES